jgi:hypothetical protein
VNSLKGFYRITSWPRPIERPRDLRRRSFSLYWKGADSPTVVNLLAGMWTGIAWISLFVDTLPSATPQHGATHCDVTLGLMLAKWVVARRSHTSIRIHRQD